MNGAITMPYKPYVVRGTIPCPILPGTTRSTVQTSHMDAAVVASSVVRDRSAMRREAYYPRVPVERRASARRLIDRSAGSTRDAAHQWRAFLASTPAKKLCGT